MRDDTIALIAVLKAKAGQTEALRDALQALLLPTREEPGNLDYALFQLRDAPDTFYMRESRRDQQALDEHIAQPYFRGLYRPDGEPARRAAAAGLSDTHRALISRASHPGEAPSLTL